VHAPPGQEPNYILRPTLRLLDQIQVGRIEANVNLAALTAAQLGASAPLSQCDGGLYLFSGAAATPDDQDGNVADGADPVIYQPVPYDGVATTATLSIPARSPSPSHGEPDANRPGNRVEQPFR
jgi:hypothetical protein